MPDTQPAATVAGQSIALHVTGYPDVPNRWGTGHIRVTGIRLDYGNSHTPDGRHAFATGLWVREDGEATDAPLDQSYDAHDGDTTDWPDWLADLAKQHTPPTARAALREHTTAPPFWIDKHPQLEAIATAVWEQCGRSDNGSCVEDDPRNIAVAALSAVSPTVDRAALIALTARACAAHLRGTYSDKWTADAARSLELNAARIERGEPTALLRRMADEAQQQPDPVSPAYARLQAAAKKATEAAHLHAMHGMKRTFHLARSYGTTPIPPAEVLNALGLDENANTVEPVAPAPVPDPTWPRRAWDLGLLHKGGDPHHCPACVAQPEPPKDFICPGADANAEVLANPQPAVPVQPAEADTDEETTR